MDSQNRPKDGGDLSWIDDAPNTLQHHLAHPEETPASYTRRKRLELGHRLMSFPRIYLDTRYWVALREVILGRSTASAGQIFDLLKQLRASNRAICPISYSVYVELLRQSDRTTRTATAQVIDLFADGTCIQPPDEVMKREVMHFLRRTVTPTKQLFPIGEMVWTKAAFVLGDCFVKPQSLPGGAANAVEKAMDDVLWSARMEDLIRTLPSSAPVRERAALERSARELNEGKDSAYRESDTFESLFIQEVSGGLEPCEKQLADIFLHFGPEFGFAGPVSEEQRIDAGKSLARLLVATFVHKRISTELPSIHIPSGLHAAVRLDRQRRYKDNDCEDFRHAVVALPYFNVFCTERSLSHLLCHKPLQYDLAYNTRICGRDDEVLQVLKSLLDSTVVNNKN